MKKPLSLLFIFILLLLLQAFSEASSPFTTGDEGTNRLAHGKEHHHGPKINCSYGCSRRCSKASRRKICVRACGACCSRCHCVPPGTYGNHRLCPCYARLRTHANKLKCP